MKLENVSSSIATSSNEIDTNKLKIDKGRRYFARVTEAYKRFGLIADDGSFKPTNAVWTYSDGNIKIKIN